ncbi:hypothetical protein LTR95_015979, partial [Oleoguttula sp. CCFEE 5521]
AGMTNIKAIATSEDAMTAIEKPQNALSYISAAFVEATPAASMTCIADMTRDSPAKVKTNGAAASTR